MACFFEPAESVRVWGRAVFYKPEVALIDRLFLWVHLSKMHSPRRAGKITSPNVENPQIFRSYCLYNVFENFFVQVR